MLTRNLIGLDAATGQIAPTHCWIRQSHPLAGSKKSDFSRIWLRHIISRGFAMGHDQFEVEEGFRQTVIRWYQVLLLQSPDQEIQLFVELERPQFIYRYRNKRLKKADQILRLIEFLAAI